MILRLIINLTRWAWGYSSLVTPEKIDGQTAMLMLLGTVMDILILIVTISLIMIGVNERKEGTK